MNEHIQNAINYAFNNKVSEMSAEVEAALLKKIEDVMANKRVEISQNLLAPEVQEEDVNESKVAQFHKIVHKEPIEGAPYEQHVVVSEPEDKNDPYVIVRHNIEGRMGEPIQYDNNLASAIRTAKRHAKKFSEKYLKKEDFSDCDEETLDEMINEALTADQGASVWIKDFLTSNDPRFKGKTAKERKAQALAAYYQAKRDNVRKGFPNTK